VMGDERSLLADTMLIDKIWLEGALDLGALRDAVAHFKGALILANIK
jgi:hypothetical protein